MSQEDIQPIISDDIKKLINRSSIVSTMDNVMDLFNEANRKFYLLGGMLSVINRMRLYKKLGCDTFADFCEGKGLSDKFKKYNLGIRERKAYYWIEIYEFFTPLGITADELSEIGWTKALCLTKLSEEKATELIKDKKSREKIKNETVEELKASIEAEMVDASAVNKVDDGDKMEKTTFKFQVWDSNKQVIRAALDKAKGIIGVEHDGEALAHICSDWLQIGGEVPLEETLRILEDKYGVEISYAMKEESAADTDKEDIVEEEDFFDGNVVEVAAKAVVPDDESADDIFDDSADNSEFPPIDDFDDIPPFGGDSNLDASPAGDDDFSFPDIDDIDSKKAKVMSTGEIEDPFSDFEDL